MSRRFQIGQAIKYTSPYRTPSTPPRFYRIVAYLPEQDGEPHYRIKADAEHFERTVGESDLYERHS